MFLTFDTETSGLLNKSLPWHDPNQPWVCQLAMVLSEGPDRRAGAVPTLLYAASFLLRSEGRFISPGALQVHGISVELCDQWGVPESSATQTFLWLFNAADTLVGHNLDFDLGMVAGMLHRQGTPEALGLLRRKQTYCTMLQGTDLCKLPGRAAGYKYPKLEQLHEHLFGVGFQGAHDALADVMATRRCYLKMNAPKVERPPAQDADIPLRPPRSEPGEPLPASDWEGALQQIEVVLEDISALLDGNESAACADFCEGVRGTLESIQDWITEKRHVTERQMQTIENIGSGVARWMR